MLILIPGRTRATTWLALAATLLMIARVVGAVERECEAGFAGPFPCLNLSQVDFVPLSSFSDTRANDLWGWTDSETGVEYVLQGTNRSTAFFRLDEKGHATYLGWLRTPNSTENRRDMKVYRNYMFVVADAPGHGMRVFDLTRLRDVPDPPVRFNSDHVYSEFSFSHNIVINEDTGYAYAVTIRGGIRCRGGLHMIDIADSLNPQFAGCFSTDGATHDAQCVIYHGPDVAYVDREICFNANFNTLTIVDVTDKASPTMLSRTSYRRARFAHQGWLTEDHEFFLMDDEWDERDFGLNTRTMVWHVAILTAPKVAIYILELPSMDHDQYIVGNHVFQGNTRSGLRILRLGDLREAELTEVAFFDTVPGNDAPGLQGVFSAYPFFESGFITVSGFTRGSSS